MKIILYIVLITISLKAHTNEECDVNSGALNTISEIAGKKCLSDDLSKNEIRAMITSKLETEEFCKTCKSGFLSSYTLKPEGKEEKKTLYSRATFDEVQKELTMISLDLMKLRSSYSIPFNASKAVISCNLDNIKKPTCLTNTQLVDFGNRISSLKGSMVSEMANILSENPTVNSSNLLNREKRHQGNDDIECKFSDKDILFVQGRFHESLITPDFIKTLKDLKIPSTGSIDLFLSKVDNSSETQKNLNILKQHPLFKALINDPERLNNFLNDVHPDDNNSKIIEKLYESKVAINYGENIADRCEQAFKKTATYLQTIYCDNNSSFVADDISSIEAIGGTNLSLMSDEQAEAHIQLSCSHLQGKESNFKSFSSIRKSINGGNEQKLIDNPLTSFKSEAYDQTFNQSKINLCKARNKTPSCLPKDNDWGCSMLNFYNLSKTKDAYQKMNNASGENINLILRSMIGNAIPQKNGKPDQEAIALLRSEGILPGGDSSTRPAQQTASAFQNAVNSQAPQKQAPKPASIPSSQGPTESESQPSYLSSAAHSAAQDEDKDSPTEPHSATARPKTAAKSNSKFSNLSDEEQQRIMDMMKRSKKSGDAASSSTNIHEVDSSSELDSSGADGQIGNMASRISSSVSKAAPSASQHEASTGYATAKKAVLDPSKKADSLNDAMVDANAARSFAGAAPTSAASTAQVSVSKSGSNENEIKIKVSEAELSQVNEFKEKLKVLLNAHGQQISVAGSADKYVVKLNNFEIDVVFNKQLNTYEARCKDASIPADYLKTISNYFNVTIKSGPGKREALVNTLKQG